MRKSLFTQKAVNLTLAILLLIFGLEGAGFAQAETFTTNEFQPFTDVVVNPCANGGLGEDVLISGILHIQQHATNNGRRVSLNIHLQTQAVTGVGLTTGDVYRSVSLSNRHENRPLFVGAGAETFNIVETFKLIGPGPDNDFIMRAHLHLTITPNGVFIPTVTTRTEVCR